MTGQEAYYKFMTYIGTHKDNELKEAFNVFEKTLEENQELKRLVYTEQLKNTEHIENEYGRALTIFQNHCVIMEDTKYASEVIMKLIKSHEINTSLMHSFEEENQELKEDMKDYEELGEDFNEYSKALEIIIKKNINLNILKTVFNGVLKFYPDMAKEYNSRIHNGMSELDSDEIRILHTVLHKIDVKCFLNEIKRGR